MAILALVTGAVIAVFGWTRWQQPASCPACECAIRVRAIRKRQLQCRICKVQMIVGPGWWRQRVTDWWVDQPPSR